jgi:hypothetical protein
MVLRLDDLHAETESFDFICDHAFSLCVVDIIRRVSCAGVLHQAPGAKFEPFAFTVNENPSISTCDTGTP